MNKWDTGGSIMVSREGIRFRNEGLYEPESVCRRRRTHYGTERADLDKEGVGSACEYGFRALCKVVENSSESIFTIADSNID